MLKNVMGKFIALAIIAGAIVSYGLAEKAIEAHIHQQQVAIEMSEQV